MKRIYQIVISALIFLTVALSGCTSQALSDLAGIANMAGNKDVENAFSSMSKATEEFTPENEYYIGRSVAANLLTNYKVYENKGLESYLNKICQALVVNSEDPYLFNGYHVKVLDTTEVNAFSTSGGHIFVTRGLLSCAESEDALAAVIAHEIGHIQLKHSIKSIKKSRNTEAIKATLNATMSSIGLSDLANDLDDMVGDAISDMVNKGYSKSQEYDADKLAVELMALAGYNPDAMVDMLNKMAELQKGKKGGFYKTHPSPKDRISHLSSTLKKNQVEDTTEYREDRYKTNVK